MGVDESNESIGSRCGKKKKKRSERSEELSKPEKKFGSANTQHTALLSNENKKERNESIFATS
jgi:hypothetical protein